MIFNSLISWNCNVGIFYLFHQHEPAWKKTANLTNSSESDIKVIREIRTETYPHWRNLSVVLSWKIRLSFPVSPVSLFFTHHQEKEDRMRPRVITSLLVFFLAVTAGGAESAVFYVSPSGSGDCSTQTTPCDFQTALDTAQNNSGQDDTIYLLPGTYTGIYQYFSDDGDGSLTIQAYDSSDAPVLTTAPNNRPLIINNDLNSSLSGAEGSTITINGLVIRDAVLVGQGGGLNVIGGGADIVIENCVLSNNTAAAGNGGGAFIRTSSGQVSLINNLFEGNHNTDSYGKGGGAYIYASSVSLTSNIFTGNTADSKEGGGIYVWTTSSSDITIDSNKFISNSATNSSGGGLFLDGASGPVIFTNNIFAGNTSGVAGGGAYVYPRAGALTVVNNTFEGNSATNTGGGLYVYLSYSSTSLNLYNNIFYNNSAGSIGGDLYTYVGAGTIQTRAYNNDFSCNDFTGGSACLYISDTTSYSNSGNISQDPLFADSANYDYHLASTSPCIDVGSNSAPSVPSTDFEGDQRIIDSTVDMGADEFGVILTSPNGGETIVSGGSRTIQWISASSLATFDLEYSINDGKTWRSITTGVTGTSYNWSVPVVAGNKRKCRVRITGYDSGSNQIGQDTSDNRFMIEVIRIISPNGGESWTRGNTYAITWDTNATKTPITKVVIKYHEVGVPGWNLITVIKGNNPGTYNWTIPTTLTPGDYKIKVNLWDANKNRRGADKSDNTFAIN